MLNVFACKKYSSQMHVSIKRYSLLTLIWACVLHELWYLYRRNANEHGTYVKISICKRDLCLIQYLNVDIEAGCMLGEISVSLK